MVIFFRSFKRALDLHAVQQSKTGTATKSAYGVCGGLAFLKS